MNIKHNDYLIMHYNKTQGKWLDKTDEIERFKEFSSYIEITFKGNSKPYKISHKHIDIYKSPSSINTSGNFYLDGHPLTGFRLIKSYGPWVKIQYSDGRSEVISKHRLKAYHDLKKDSNNQTLKFQYFYSLAQALKHDEESYLKDLYQKTSFNQNHALSKYLKGENNYSSRYNDMYIFPFGLNLSQKKAVENAFKNDISVIEGPPGTGKTQTILNILMNCIIQKKTVAVVSNNNAAITNIEDKLKEFKLDFLIAKLGNTINKKTFFEESIHQRKSILPDEQRLSKSQLQSYKNKTRYYQETLPTLYNLENQMAVLKNDLKLYNKEYGYFIDEHKNSMLNNNGRLRKKLKTSAQALKLKALFESGNGLSRFSKFLHRLMYGISFNQHCLQNSINTIDDIYYTLKIKEIKESISDISKQLDNKDFKASKKAYQDISNIILQDFLSYKYNKLEPHRFTYRDYRYNFNNFIEEYPIILSTSYALLPSAGKDYLFDYLIIDEASQTDLLSSVLAMSCAKKMVVVGDTKQLPHIEKQELESLNSELKKKYNMPQAYDYFTQSILSSVISVFKDIPKVLLKEHYRSNAAIINFCNQKYYENSLVVLTENNNASDDSLKLIVTVPGNHARKNPFGSGLYNQREIDEIKELLSDINDKSVGIITPYRYQADCISKSVYEIAPHIESDTVHKFQGRAKDVIILSTVANDINENADNKKENFIARSDLLNVAISRAKNQLILIVSDKVFRSQNNDISDLIKYIKYHGSNISIAKGRVKSIYDVLYKDYQVSLFSIRQKQHKKMFDSELVTLNLINKIINPISNLSVLMHYPLKKLIHTTETLSEKEKDYVSHPWTHVDFVIINTLTKEVRLVIEVDGISYHEQNTKQLNMDSIKDKVLKMNDVKLLRLKTNDSGEEKKIANALVLE